jgi:hypothetical protein
MKPLTSFLDTDGCWYVIPLPCYWYALVSQEHTLESLFCTKVKHFVTHAVYSALKSSNMTLKLSYFTLGYVSKKWETCFVQSIEKLIPLSITLELTLVYAISIYRFAKWINVLPRCHFQSHHQERMNSLHGNKLLSHPPPHHQCQ